MKQTKSKLPEYSYRNSLKDEEFKLYKKIAVIAISTLVILVLFSWVSVPFINFIGNFWQIFKSTGKVSVTTPFSPLIKPRLEPIPVAVNTDKIEVKGYSSNSVTIKMFVNDSLMASTVADQDGTFSFAGVKLKEGLNKLGFVAVDKDKKESDQELITVTLDKKPPLLNLSNPPEGAKYDASTKEVLVTGTTDPDANVTVSEFQAIVSKEGFFSFSLPLKNGANKIKIVSTDLAQNQTVLERTVSSDRPPEATSAASTP